MDYQGKTPQGSTGRRESGDDRFGTGDRVDGWRFSTRRTEKRIARVRDATDMYERREKTGVERHGTTVVSSGSRTRSAVPANSNVGTVSPATEY